MKVGNYSLYILPFSKPGLCMPGVFSFAKVAGTMEIASYGFSERLRSSSTGRSRPWGKIDRCRDMNPDLREKQLHHIIGNIDRISHTDPIGQIVLGIAGIGKKNSIGTGWRLFKRRTGL